MFRFMLDLFYFFNVILSFLSFVLVDYQQFCPNYFRGIFIYVDFYELTEFVHVCLVNIVSDRVRWRRIMATFELYRRSTIGMCLTETLDEMVQNGTLSPELAIQVLVQFDKVCVGLLFFFFPFFFYIIRFRLLLAHLFMFSSLNLLI